MTVDSVVLSGQHPVTPHKLCHGSSLPLAPVCIVCVRGKEGCLLLNIYFRVPGKTHR